MRHATLFLLAITLSTPIVSAQSLEFWDTKPDEIYISIRCLDETKSMSFSVDTAAGVFGLGKRTYSTHTPDQLIEYGSRREMAHFSKTKENKTITSPHDIVIRLKHSEGARYKITFDDLKTCPECKQRKGNRNNEYENEMYQKGKIVTITLMETGKNFANRKGWVIDNRSGILKHEEGGYWIDPKKLGSSFNITCIDLNMPETGASIFMPKSAFNKLDAYKVFAEGAYNKKLGDSIKVKGDLRHSAPFELKPSEKNLDYFLLSYGHGDSRTHRNYQYDFKVIDIAEGHSETFSASILQGIWDLFLFKFSYPNINNYLPPKEHPAGAIPMGFRAITCKCNCCPSDPKYVVAFAGTTAWSKSDWHSNVTQGIPIGTSGNLPYESRVAPHYEYAIKYTSWVIKQNSLNTPGSGGFFSYPSAKNLSVSGHSLGGGLASYVSGYFSVPGFGYNPAPLASAAQVLMNGKRRPDEYFTNVRVSLDPVSGLLPVIPNQRLVGQVFTVESTGEWGSSFTVNDHMIGSIGSRVTSYKAPKPFEKQTQIKAPNIEIGPPMVPAVPNGTPVPNQNVIPFPSIKIPQIVPAKPGPIPTPPNNIGSIFSGVKPPIAKVQSVPFVPIVTPVPLPLGPFSKKTP